MVAVPAARGGQGYIEPPVVEFMDVSDPGTLLAPDLTGEQVAAATELVSASLEAPEEFNPIWRAIAGARTDALVRTCETLELTVLAFRGSWYNKVEKTLDPERLKHLTSFVGKDHLDYTRTTTRGECAQ